MKRIPLVCLELVSGVRSEGDPASLCCPCFWVFVVTSESSFSLRPDFQQFWLWCLSQRARIGPVQSSLVFLQENCSPPAAGFFFAAFDHRRHRLIVELSNLTCILSGNVFVAEDRVGTVRAPQPAGSRGVCLRSACLPSRASDQRKIQ